jgi:UDP-N-acetyl-D-glucosamine dehydrogenase
VGDLRESPALKLIGLLRERGAEVGYHDPFVPSLAAEHLDLTSAPLTDALLADADIVCVVTAHSGIDYARVAEHAQLVIDFRNAVPEEAGDVVKL